MDGCVSLCFFFNDTATTEIYTLSLHDALPISLSVQVRIFRRRYSSSRSPYARRWMTRILVLSPSTNPRENFSSDLQYAAIPLQFRSTNAANFSKGLSRCHLSDSFQLSKNRRAHPSRRYHHNWSNDSLSR